MSVTLVLDDEIDISRGDLLAAGDVEVEVGQRFEAEIVWMDERPLDPARVYLPSTPTRTVSAEVDHGLVLNQIGSATVTTARPLIFDRYTRQPLDRQLHPDRSGHQLHRRRRHDHQPGPAARGERRAAERRRAAGAPGAGGGVGRRRHGSRPARARGDTDVSDQSSVDESGMAAQSTSVVASQRSGRRSPRLERAVCTATRHGSSPSSLAGAGRACITCSFQAEDVALLHMLLAGEPGDSGALPRHRAPLRADLRVPRRAGRELASEPRQPARGGARSGPVADEHRRVLRQAQGRAAVLRARRLRPLVHGPAPAAVGVAREPAEVEPFRLPSGRSITKISPLAAWTTKDVWQYTKAHAIPLLPLYELGYTSIGCEPCTSVPLDPDDPRSGRWSGQKLECGIHIEPAVK